MLESFELHRVVYDLDRTAYAQTRDVLMALLELDEMAAKPARKLSLGQRMRCEFVAALLHRPSVVLLDEPTLGLDFDAQLLIRQFVARYVESSGAAAILTDDHPRRAVLRAHLAVVARRLDRTDDRRGLGDLAALAPGAAQLQRRHGLRRRRWDARAPRPVTAAAPWPETRR